MSHAALIASYANPLIVCDSAAFDGTNDVLKRGGGLSGQASSKLFTLSTWIWITDSLNTFMFEGVIAIGDSITRFSYRKFTNNFIIVDAQNSSGIAIFAWNYGSAIATGGWHHVLMSIDLSDTGKRHFYIDDVATGAAPANYTNDSIDFSGCGDWAVGGRSSSSFRLNGRMAEHYFAIGQYFDFSNVYNRRKFISSGGKPVHLGADGSMPNGIAPAVYLHLADGEAVADFATNRGTGGNFSITGTLDTGATSPSD